MKCLFFSSVFKVSLMRKCLFIHLNYSTELQWTAPELLRSEKTIDKQKADIFSLGIILKEIFTRSGPYTEYPFLKIQGEENLLDFQGLHFRSLYRLNLILKIMSVV